MEEIDRQKTVPQRGRPKVVTNHIGRRICDLLSKGQSLRKIASMPGMPARSTIQREIAKNSQFSGQYRRARAMAGDTFADKIIEIANATLAGEHDPNAAELAVRAYQWTAGKLNPGEYGNHQQVDVSVAHDMSDHAPDWLRHRLAPENPRKPAREVIDLDARPALANTPSALAASITAAASEEVKAETPSDSGMQPVDI